MGAGAKHNLGGDNLILICFWGRNNRKVFSAFLMPASLGIPRTYPPAPLQVGILQSLVLLLTMGHVRR